MASRFWVGGTGNWDASTTTNWSATSGGAGGQSVPTSADTVTFDTASNATAYTVTITATANCSNLTIGNPLSGVLTFAGTSNLNIFGSLTAGFPNTNFTHTGTITFKATSTINILVSATIASPIVLDGVGGTFQLANPLVSNVTGGGYSLTLTNGTFDTSTNNYAFTGNGFNSNNTNTRVINLHSSVISVNTGLGIDLSQITGLTFSGASSTITLTGSNASISSGGLTFGTININSTGSNIVISGSNTINTINSSAVAKTIKFANGKTQTISTWGISGTAGNVITITSDTTGTHTLTKVGGKVSADYLNIQHSVATPSTTWYAGLNSTDNQAVVTAGSGWTFTGVPVTYTMDCLPATFTYTPSAITETRRLILACNAAVYSVVAKQISAVASLYQSATTRLTEFLGLKKIK